MAAKKKAKKAAKRVAATVASGRVTTLVNGQVTGDTEVNGHTVGEVATRMAREAGLKAFCIRVNGVAIQVEDGGKPLKGAKSLEVYAKDTRG